MARKKGSINVSGMSIHDIMNIDIETFNKLNEIDLRRLTSRLVSAGNKRIRNIEKSGVITPAYKNLGTATRFSTKVPKSLSRQQYTNAIRQEFARARNFLSLKTSTISGYKKVVKETKQRLSEETGLSLKDINKLDINRGFEIFHKLQESGQIAPKGSDGSPKFRDYMFKMMVQNPEISDKNLMNDLINFDEDLYEEETEEFEW